MKTLFGTSALVMALALALPAFAQDTTLPEDITPPADTTAPADTAPPADTATDMTTGAVSPYLEGVDGGVRASAFIGKRIYVTGQDTSTMPVDALAEADTAWENAGEISDLIMSMNGEFQAVLVDFGGFLGIGSKTVAITMDDLVLVPDSRSRDDYFIVFHGSKAELEAAPEFNPDMVFSIPPEEVPLAPADGMAPADPAGADPAMMPPAYGTDTGADTAAMGTADEALDLTVMTEADLIGRRVIGPNDEDVGEVSAVAIGADGTIEGAIVDVGGFLGIGEKRVSLGSDALRIVRDAGGTIDHFRVTMTQGQLEALPAYEG